MDTRKVFCLTLVLLILSSHLAFGEKWDIMGNNVSFSDAAQKGRITTQVKVLSEALATTDTTTTVLKYTFSGSVLIHGQGGAIMSMIYANLKADQTSTSHADVWIIEGGVNDIKWFGDPDYLVAQYTDYLHRIVAYSQVCGVELFFQEMTPVVDEIINAYPYWMGLNVPGKIIAMNEIMRKVASDHGAKVIEIYTPFYPNWPNWSDTWGSSVHPNATGAEKLAEAWAGGIKEGLTRESTIYVCGDSITNCVTSESFLTKVAKLFPNAAKPSWNMYE